MKQIKKKINLVLIIVGTTKNTGKAMSTYLTMPTVLENKGINIIIKE